MNRRLLILSAPILATALLWSGAASAAPPNGGTISIEPKTVGGDYDPSMQAFVNAATEALTDRGFTILEGHGHAAYVVELMLGRTEVGTGTAKIPASRAGVTLGGPGPSAGAGVVVPFSSGQTALVPLQRVRLEMRIHKRGDPAVLWDGAAVTVRAAGTKKGADPVVATDLSAALMRAYPNQPDDVIGVP